MRNNPRKHRLPPFEKSGIILVNKPADWTSHDVVSFIRARFNVPKAGHCGTLDPAATGLLVVVIGKFTKLSQKFSGEDKTYEGTILLGTVTDSQDLDGEVIQQNDWSAITPERLEEGFMNFLGDIEQVPPMVSAVKKDGKRLYALAREGIEVEREAKPITIESIKLTRIELPYADFVVKCSKGTYIRTLCSDIGKALGCGGHMAELLRTRTGAFSLENAIKLDELKALAEQEKVETVLLTMEEALEDFPVVKVSEKSQKFLYNGGKIQERFLTEKPAVLTEGEIVATYDYENNLVGLYEMKKEESNFFIKPFKMLV
jgi:tRNA pseudouridine55 synthase